MSRMNQVNRLTSIVTVIEEEAACSVTALASRFAVSEETIRRDLRQLENVGRVVKVHGGVRLPDNRLEAPYRTRLREQAQAKQAIGRLAARRIENGMTVLIDSGTTSFWVARELAHLRGLTIVTNSLEVAGEMLGRGDHRLFLAGGAMNADYRAAFDADAIAYGLRFVVDVAVMSIGAIETDRGFLDFDAEEAAYKRAMLPRARRVMMVADHSKFDRRGTVHVADFGQVDDLVVDTAPAQSLITAFRAAGTQLHIVSDADRSG